MASDDFSDLGAPTQDPLLPAIPKLERSPTGSKSPAGALGLYQVMPDTARRLGFTDMSRLQNDDAYGAQAAGAVLADLRKQHGSDDEAVIAGYNSSPKGIAGWLKSRNDADLPGQTRDYLKRYRALGSTPDFSDLGKPDFSDMGKAAEPIQQTVKMPGAMAALTQGVVQAGQDVLQSGNLARGRGPVGSLGAKENTPAASPLAWSDVQHPIAQLLPKLAYQLGHSAPSLAGGVLGGVAGAAIPGAGETGVGEVIGGGLGAASGEAVQVIGPMFKQRLAETPKDPEGAWQRTMGDVERDAGATGVGWALFGLQPFKGPIKNMLFQAFGVQPGVSAGQQALQNIAEGKPASQDLRQAYAQGVAGTLPFAAGHALLHGVLGDRTRTGQAGEKTPDEQLKDIVNGAPPGGPSGPSPPPSGPSGPAPTPRPQLPPPTGAFGEGFTMGRPPEFAPTVENAPPEVRGRGFTMPGYDPNVIEGKYREVPTTKGLPSPEQVLRNSAHEWAAAEYDFMKKPEGAKDPSIIDAIIRRGGIKAAGREGAEIRAVAKDYNRPGLINKNGLAPDDMRQALQEEGWFGRTDNEDLETGTKPGDDIQDLYDAVGRTAQGKPYYHPESEAARGDQTRQEIMRSMMMAGVGAADDRKTAIKKLGDWYAAQTSHTTAPEALQGYEPGADEFAAFNRINAPSIADEHEDEVRRIETEAMQAAAKKRPEQQGMNFAEETPEERAARLGRQTIQESQQLPRAVPKKPQKGLPEGGLFGEPAEDDLFTPPTSKSAASPERVGIGADLRRMIDIFGPKMYGENMPDVTTKELLQNSFDAIKSAYKRGDIKPGEGHVHVAVDHEKRTISLSDNGAGMTPETVKKAFLTVAGTEKGDLSAAERSGGFGIAKLAFIFGNDGLKMTTVHDGVKTILDTNSQELLYGKAQLQTFRTSGDNGTHVEVKIPKQFKDQNGEMRDMPMPWSHDDLKIFQRPLIGDVKVTAESRYGEPKVLPLGQTQELPPKMTTAHFPWGDVDVHGRPAGKDESLWRMKHQWLSSGLFQFDRDIAQGPGTESPYSPLPFQLVFNVKPKVAAEDNFYPFNNQREGISKKVEKDVAQLEAFLRKHHRANIAQGVAGNFATAEMMPQVRTRPSEKEKPGYFGLFGHTGQEQYRFGDARMERWMPQTAAEKYAIPPDLSIKDGKTLIGNHEIDAVAEMKEPEKLTHSQFKLQPSQVPHNLPLYHNNLNVDVISEAEKRFDVPQSQSRRYLAAVGTVVKDFRDALAKVGDRYAAWGEPGRPVGVSLDKGYHGVHVRVPYQGFFLNPISSKRASPAAIAADMTHTLMHEAAHTISSGHDESFTSAHADLDGTFEEKHPGLKAKIQKRFEQIIEDHKSAFEAMREVYNDPTTENAANNEKSIAGKSLREPGEPDRVSGRARELREEPPERVSQRVPPRGPNGPGKGGEGGDRGGPPPVNGKPPSPPPNEGLFHYIRGEEDKLQRLKGESEADKVQGMRFINSLPKEAKDAALNEKMHHYGEDPAGNPLTPGEKAIFDRYVQPLRVAANGVYNQLRSQGVDVGLDGYMHRIAKGKGTMYDPQDPLSGLSTNPLYMGGRGLGQKTASMYERSLWMADRGDGSGEIIRGNYKPGDKYEMPDGSKATVRQATTKEIESATDVRYYKNATANALDNYLRLKRVARNVEYLNGLKDSLEKTGLAYRMGSDTKAPQGFKETSIPQLRGYLMEPRLARMLDKFYEIGPQGDLGLMLSKVNHALTSAIFLNPISALFGHGMNVATHWFVGRGWDNFLPNTWGRSASNFMRAWKDVADQSPAYENMLRNGNALLYGPTLNRDFHQTMIKLMGGELAKDPKTWGQIAREAGTSPKHIYQALSDLSSRGLWFANDVFMLQRVYDLQGKGLSARDAVTEAEHEIPNYRIPSEAWDSHAGRAFSDLMSNPNLFIFSRYRYGLIHAYAKTLGDAFGKGKSSQERMKAAGQLLALGVMFGVLYPAADQIAQQITGNKNAFLRRAGPASALDAVYQWAKQGRPGGDNSGDIKNLFDAMNGLFAPAPGSGALAQAIVNRDFFTGKHIWNPQGSPDEIAGELGEYAATRPLPGQQAEELLTSRKEWPEVAASWIGINSPTQREVGLRRHYAGKDYEADRKAWLRKRAKIVRGVEHLFGAQ